jgi:sugar phosphate isomerase/epimerase
MKRRDFIQSSLLAVAGAGMLSSFTLEDRKKIGLQLYSLRDVINKDVKGTLKQVADFGYKELETYGYKDGSLFGMKAAEFGSYVKSLGMRVTSGHYGVDQVKTNWEKACADAKEVGQEYVAVAWMDKQYYSTMSELKKLLETFNKAAETAKAHGLHFAYHNHDFEFGKVDGEVIYDVMLKELDPKLVSFEMDLFWVVYANQNPVDYFAKHPGRFQQWHVKDMTKEDRTKNANVGTGTIDFKSIFAKSKEAGLKHFYIEQETYPVAPVESIKESIAGLKAIL